MKYHQPRVSTLMTNLIAVLITFTCSAATFGQCEAAQLMAEDGGGGNDFARSVSIDGDIAVVGDDLIEKVYIFRRGDGGPGDWALEQILTPPKPPLDQFGWRVRIQDDVIVIGAPTANVPQLNQGTVFIYRWDVENQLWQLQQQLTASDGESGDNFGQSVSIDGNVLLIGARGDVVNGISEAGSAYVFRYDNQLKQWNEEAKLTHPNAETLDLLGQSVAIRGDIAIVGAHAIDGRFIGTGAAFVFLRDSNRPKQWNLIQKLTGSDPSPSAQFGWFISLADGVALIGAMNADGQNGTAYIFTYDPDGSGWTEQIKLSGSDPIGVAPRFGYSVALSDDAATALIGAPGDDVQGFHAGAVYLFRNNDSGWKEIEKLLASDGSASDIFGTSVSISDTTGLLGAPGQSEFPGTAYVFELDPPLGDLDCDGAVGIDDLLALLSNWGPCGDCDADLDGNGVVGASDLLILLSNWGS